MTSLFPTALEIKKEAPLSSTSLNFIKKSQEITKKILLKEDKRFLIVVGPCSVHNLKSLKEYALRLKELSLKVEEKLFLILRFFIEKPRTHLGWRGFAVDPNLDSSFEIEKGILASRKALLELASLEIPCATEFLDPLMTPYISDLITYGVIGSRTSSSQIHRQLASSFSFPIGFKNSSSDFKEALYSAHASSLAQKFISLNEEGKLIKMSTLGNPYAHIILRGTKDGANYFLETQKEIEKEQEALSFNRGFLIDCAHGNSQKNYKNQSLVFNYLIQKKQKVSSLRGILLESFLEEGKQVHSTNPLERVSITDECLSFNETEKLILEAFKSISCA